MAVRLFIKDKSSGKVHEYGTDKHDSLYIVKGTIKYSNMQNLCDSPHTYEFVHNPAKERDDNDNDLFD